MNAWTPQRWAELLCVFRLNLYLPCYRSKSVRARSPAECLSSCSPSPVPSEQKGGTLDPRAILRSLGTRRRCRASSFLKQGRTRRRAAWARWEQIYEGSQSTKSQQEAGQPWWIRSAIVQVTVWLFGLLFFFNCFESLSKEGMMEWRLHCRLLFYHLHT